LNPGAFKLWVNWIKRVRPHRVRDLRRHQVDCAIAVVRHHQRVGAADATQLSFIFPLQTKRSKRHVATERGVVSHRPWYHVPRYQVQLVTVLSVALSIGVRFVDMDGVRFADMDGVRFVDMDGVRFVTWTILGSSIEPCFDRCKTTW
jgi:hypothetical protein